MPPALPPSWHRLGPRDMPLVAKRSRHVPVAIPEVRIGRGISMSPRQKSPQPAVTQRDMPLSEAPIRIARRAEPVPQSIPVCLSRNLGRCAVVGASGLNPVRFDGADISPRDALRRQYHQRPKHSLSPPITSLLRFLRSPPLTHAVTRHVSRFMDN